MFGKRNVFGWRDDTCVNSLWAPHQPCATMFSPPVGRATGPLESHRFPSACPSRPLPTLWSAAANERQGERGGAGKHSLLPFRCRSSCRGEVVHVFTRGHTEHALHTCTTVCVHVCVQGGEVLELCKTLKRLETACDVPVRQHWDLGRLTPCGLSLDLTYTPRIGMAEFTGHSVRMPAKAEQATALVWFLTFTLQFLQNQDFPEDKWNPEQSLYS